MDIAPALLLATLLWQVIDFLKEVRGRDWSSALTQVCAWVAGVVVVMLAAHAQLFEPFAVNGISITDMEGWSQVFLGLTIASFGSTLVDVKQALDGTDTATKPPLLRAGGSPPPGG